MKVDWRIVNTYEIGIVDLESATKDELKEMVTALCCRGEQKYARLNRLKLFRLGVIPQERPENIHLTEYNRQLRLKRDLLEDAQDNLERILLRHNGRTCEESLNMQSKIISIQRDMLQLKQIIQALSNQIVIHFSMKGESIHDYDQGLC